MSARRVIVVGAGVSGLAAAHRLRELDPTFEVEIIEASERPGGWLRTVERDGFVVELGPDSILTEKPHALALVRRLGIERATVRERRRGQLTGGVEHRSEQELSVRMDEGIALLFAHSLGEEGGTFVRI